MAAAVGATGEWFGVRLRRDWRDSCDARARASLDPVHCEREEDCVRSGVAASGERPCRRSAGLHRSRYFRPARCRDAETLRNADVLVGGSSRSCRLDTARLHDHRIGAVGGSRRVLTSSRYVGFRRFGDPGGLGRCHHGDRLVSGRRRSASPVPRRSRCLRGRRGRLVAAPRSFHPHDGAPVRVLHRLWHRPAGTGGGSCRESGGKPSLRSRAPETDAARLGHRRSPPRPTSTPSARRGSRTGPCT